MSRLHQTGVIPLPTAFLVGPVVSAGPGPLPVARHLRALGYDVVEVDALAHLPAAVASAPPGRVALVDGRFVGHLHALRRAVCDSRPEAIAGPGTLAVAPSARPHLLDALAAVTARTSTTVTTGTTGTTASTAPTTSSRSSRPDAPPVDIARVADALAARVTVARTDPAPLVAGIAESPQERAALEARARAVDEESYRLKSAVKAEDTAFTTFFVRSYSGYAARWFARLGLGPNHVTILSLIVALGAAATVATGTRSSYVLGALLFHAAFSLDCIDGDLARYTVSFSKLGARMDLTFDRVKEYALFAGLAIGAARDGDPHIWWLAAAAMAFQTVRHQMHAAYEEVSAGPAEDAPALADQVQARIGGSRWKVWLRRGIVLPQGERSALICLLVAFTNPQVVFVVLLAVGVIAAAYAFLGRLLRSLRRVRRPWSKSAGLSLGALVDVGPVGWIVHTSLPGRSLPAPLAALVALLVLVFSLAVIPAVGVGWVLLGVLWYVLIVGFASRQPLNGWADWVLPPTFRAAEYALAIVLAATLAPAALPAAFGYVAACAFHHYDTIYRLSEDGTHPRRRLTVVTGGHDGRMLVLALLALGGATVFQVGLTVLAVALAVVFVAESVIATAAQVRDRDATGVPAAEATAGVAR
ncbi:Phosphatidylglycerophosphate synthase [Actinopolymorpha cephalotaxi]|uniref:Phosphatidylglycerophosphate synthase n=1 Tax=Actinopolymorpha cephalotaxi TaxID=504797 RepID=A0A1I2KMN6_9ACTN|nr:DUF5941 domain-containing protein [Actinopolymorpha cephalotaxi]NYH84547.1 phosphatidylglycerophosphate synthase [Actinopolymorpha cephalotaxi]SFF68234.1 Phosphatidylglycerophosphate synthase [Actinopolymorpha cephalotaxi]